MSVSMFLCRSLISPHQTPTPSPYYISSTPLSPSLLSLSLSLPLTPFPPPPPLSLQHTVTASIYVRYKSARWLNCLSLSFPKCQDDVCLLYMGKSYLLVY